MLQTLTVPVRTLTPTIATKPDWNSGSIPPNFFLQSYLSLTDKCLVAELKIMPDAPVLRYVRVSLCRVRYRLRSPRV